MKKKEYFVMDYNEFDKLVHDNFPERKDYDFCSSQEASNGVSYTFNKIGIPIKYKEDTPQEKIDEWKKSELKDFEKWLRKEKYSFIGPNQILEALIRKGVLEPGNYLVEVSW